jgi:hypothetical protein
MEGVHSMVVLVGRELGIEQNAWVFDRFAIKAGEL